MTLLADSYESPVQKIPPPKNICDTNGSLVCLVSSLSLFWQELVRQVLSAIRAIAGNDDVKDAVVSAGGVELIIIAMNRNMSNPAVSCFV